MAQRLADGVVMHEGQVWTMCKARKVHTCHECDHPMKKGVHLYRPQTNGDNRMHRICRFCMITLCGEWKGVQGGKPSTPRQRRSARH